MWLAKQLFVITSSLLMKRPLSVVTAKALFSYLIPCFESAFMRAVANILLNCVLGREKKTKKKQKCSSSPGCDKTSEEMTINSSSFFNGVSPRGTTLHPKTLKAALMYYLTTPRSADTECQWLQSIWHHGPECLFKWWFNWPNGRDTEDKFQEAIDVTMAMAICFCSC